MAEEHFGIAVAEMVRAGCVVFVPDGGGQVEIVGQEDRLRYTSAADAVAKILQVMRDPDAQAALRGRLAARKDLFGAERFVRRVQEIVVHPRGDDR
jgi:glycosyltransferase involved in cell wall biosynthesis